MSLFVKRFQGLPATPKYCPDCDTAHIGPVPCGMTWKQRVLSQTVSGDVYQSRTKKRYWDQEALDEQFGPDATEKTLEDTQGKGYGNVTMDEMFPEASD